MTGAVFVKLGSHVSVVVLSMTRFYAFSFRPDERPLSIYASAEGLGVLNGSRVATLTRVSGEGTCSVARLILLEGDPRLWQALGWRQRRRGELLVLVGLGPLGAGRTRHDEKRDTVLPVVVVVVVVVVAAGSGRRGGCRGRGSSEDCFCFLCIGRRGGHDDRSS